MKKTMNASFGTSTRRASREAIYEMFMFNGWDMKGFSEYVGLQYTRNDLQRRIREGDITRLSWELNRGPTAAETTCRVAKLREELKRVKARMAALRH